MWIAPAHTNTCSKSIGAGAPVGAGELGSERTPAVDDQPVDAVLAQQTGAGIDSSGQVRTRHALAATCGGVTAVGVGHPTRDLVVLPPESLGTLSQQLAGRRVAAWHRLDRERPLDLVAGGEELVVPEVVDRVVGAPTRQRRLGRTSIQAAVDLGATAGAAALGVGDRRSTEGDGHPARAVLAVHLFERERHDGVLFDPGPFLDDQHVESGFGQQGGRRRAACARSDHQDLAIVVRPGLGQLDHGRLSDASLAPVGCVHGQVSQMNANPNERTIRASSPTNGTEVDCRKAAVRS